MNWRPFLFIALSILPSLIGTGCKDDVAEKVSRYCDEEYSKSPARKDACVQGYQFAREAFDKKRSKDSAKNGCINAYGYKWIIGKGESRTFYVGASRKGVPSYAKQCICSSLPSAELDPSDWKAKVCQNPQRGFVLPVNRYDTEDKWTELIGALANCEEACRAGVEESWSLQP